MLSILLIKHGALGDTILATPAVAALRQHYHNAALTMLCAPAYADYWRASGYVNHIITDPRAPWWQFWRTMPLLQQLATRGFRVAIDLQDSSRSRFYYRCLQRRIPDWAGSLPSMRWPHPHHQPKSLHPHQRHAQLLQPLGINTMPTSAWAWATSAIQTPPRLAVLVPGASAHRPEKKWPVASYAQLAVWLAAAGYNPVVVGTQAEDQAAQIIQAAAPATLNLCGKTTMVDLVALGHRASFIIGNDSGPTHALAAGGKPSFVLFSAASSPALNAPYGAHVTCLQAPDLSALTPAVVCEKLASCLTITAQSEKVS